MITTNIIQANNSTHQEIDTLMADLQQKRINDEIADTLIFVEHPDSKIAAKIRDQYM